MATAPGEITEGRHTPGPWKAERGTHGWHIGPQPDGVCTIHDNSGHFEWDRQEANAHLIAATPTLLGVAKAAETLARKLCLELSQGMGIAPKSDEHFELRNLLNELQKAIASAAVTNTEGRRSNEGPHGTLVST